METIDQFLGVRIIRNRVQGTISLVYDTYIEKIANKFGLTTSLPRSTPLPGIELTKYEGIAPFGRIKKYQEKVGSVLYPAILIRPDITYAASRLFHFLTNPSEEHIKAMNWTIKYLQSTRYLAIQYSIKQQEIQLFIASNTSFANDTETRRSSQGFTITLFGGVFNQKASLQAIVTTLITEAELLGVKKTAKVIIALKRLFAKILLNLGKVWKIYCDNK